MFRTLLNRGVGKGGGKGDMPPPLPGNSHAEKKLWVFG